MAIKIALANQKGGIGKTTSSIELAACFKNRGYNVLLIDLEQQCDTTKYSGGNMYKPGSYEAIKGTMSIKDVIQHVDEYDLLASSPALSNSDVEFSNPTDVLKLRKVLKEVNDDYDFILMDTNPGRNKLLNMAYIAADYVLIPAEADDGSVDGIRSIFKDLEEYNEAEWTDAEVLGVIYCRYEATGQHRFQEEEMKKVLDENGSDAFIMRVRKCIQATEAKSEGTSMQKGKKSCTAAIDYRRIADRIIDMMEEE